MMISVKFVAQCLAHYTHSLNIRWGFDLVTVVMERALVGRVQKEMATQICT